MPTFVDLTHPLTDGQVAYPGDPPPRIAPIVTSAGGGCNLTHIAMTVHQGTHVDAPYHFLDDGAAIDKVPLEPFCGPARLIDFAPEGVVPPGFEITPERLAPYAGAFTAGDRLVIRTGWSKFFGQENYFYSAAAEEFGQESCVHSAAAGERARRSTPPQITPEAAAWIASTGILLLGIDWSTPSHAQVAAVHQRLLGARPPIVLLENLAHLEHLPATFTLIAFPLRIAGADGSPVRAVAVLDERA